MKPWAERFYNSDAWRSCRDSFLKSKGYKAALCYGWEQAAGTIIEYLTGGGTHD